MPSLFRLAAAAAPFALAGLARGADATMDSLPNGSGDPSAQSDMMDALANLTDAMGGGDEEGCNIVSLMDSLQGLRSNPACAVLGTLASEGADEMELATSLNAELLPSMCEGPDACINQVTGIIDQAAMCDNTTDTSSIDEIAGVKYLLCAKKGDVWCYAELVKIQPHCDLDGDGDHEEGDGHDHDHDRRLQAGHELPAACKAAIAAADKPCLTHIFTEVEKRGDTVPAELKTEIGYVAPASPSPAPSPAPSDDDGKSCFPKPSLLGPSCGPGCCEAFGKDDCLNRSYDCDWKKPDPPPPAPTSGATAAAAAPVAATALAAAAAAIMAA